jgi:hypothetical protein
LPAQELQAFLRMPSSALATATRAFVTVLLVLAREYELALEINRDSPAEELVKAYKRVLQDADRLLFSSCPTLTCPPFV